MKDDNWKHLYDVRIINCAHIFRRQVNIQPTKLSRISIIFSECSLTSSGTKIIFSPSKIIVITIKTVKINNCKIKLN